MLKRSLIGAIAALALALPAAAQDSYVIGLTGAMTGPAAGTLGPAVEGLRLYIDKLNASGGIDGRKVNLPPAAVGEVEREYSLAPGYGEHTRAILEQSGVSAEEIEDLLARGVVH